MCNSKNIINGTEENGLSNPYFSGKVVTKISRNNKKNKRLFTISQNIISFIEWIAPIAIFISLIKKSTNKVKLIYKNRGLMPQVEEDGTFIERFSTIQFNPIKFVKLY